MNFLKKIFGSLDQRGVIHLIPLFLLLAGIIVGVYLVQKEGFQLFKPKAAGETVEFLPGNCVKVNKEGKQVLVCDQFQMKIRSPLETGTTTDAGFQLVKTAYAATNNLVGDKCGSDPSAIYNNETLQISTCESGASCRENTFRGVNFLNFSIGDVTQSFCVNNSGAPVIDVSDNWECGENNTQVQEKGEIANFFGILRRKSIKCPSGTSCKTDNGRVTCVAPVEPGSSGGQAAGSQARPGNIEPRGEVSVAADGQIDFAWAGPTNTKKYTFYIDNIIKAENRPHENLAGHGNIQGGALGIRTVVFEDGKTYTWWVDALDENGNTIGTSDGFQIKIHKTAAPQQTPQATPRADCPDKKATYGQCGGTVGLEGKDPTHQYEVTEVRDCNNRLKPYPPAVDKGVSTQCQQAAAARGGTSPSCSSGQAGSVTAAQAQCVLNLRSDVLTAYKSFGWCTQEIDKPGVVNDWYNKLAGPTDKQQVSNCFSGAAAAPATNCTRGEVPTGNRYLDANQTNCLLNLRKDIVPQYIKDGWCSDEANKQSIAIDWYFKLASPVEKAQATKECPNIPPAEGGTQARTTTKYRVATNPTALETATWYDYTAGGVVVNIPSAGYFSIDNSLGTKSIYVQFMDNLMQKITFSSGNNFSIANIDLVDIASIGTGGTTGGSAGAVSCTSVTLNSGNGNPGGNASLTLSYNGAPQSLKVWMASNVEVGKSASQVTDWSPVLADNASSYVTFKIPAGADLGAHAILVSLHDGSGQMLDGNVGGVVNTKCTSMLNVQSAESGTPSAGGGSPSQTGRTYAAQCSGVSVISSAKGVGIINISYTGNPVYMEVWMGEEMGVDASQVQNWRKVNPPEVPYPIARTGAFNFNVPTDIQQGNHAVMIALRDNLLSMLDGNPNGVLNPSCATTFNVK